MFRRPIRSETSARAKQPNCPRCRANCTHQDHNGPGTHSVSGVWVDQKSCKTELSGYKRIARACGRSLSSWGDTALAVSSKDTDVLDTGADVDSDVINHLAIGETIGFQWSTDVSIEGTPKPTEDVSETGRKCSSQILEAQKKASSKPGTSSRATLLNINPMETNADYNLKRLFDRRLSEELTKLKDLSLNDERYFNPKPTKSNVTKSQYSKSSVNVLQPGARHTLASMCSSDNLNFKRVVIVTNVPPQTGINSLLSQVCGGPLERVSFNEGASSLELHFVFPDHAKRFHAYSKQGGMFVVNRWRPETEWANSYNTESVYNTLISKHLLHDVLQYGARRTLILAKVVPLKVCRPSKKLFYPEAAQHFSKGVQISEIIADFQEYGEILEISPVISSRLCFSVHFTDIRSSIMAKRDCETEGTPIFRKYGEWMVWYGKDIADKLCPAL